MLTYGNGKDQKTGGRISAVFFHGGNTGAGGADLGKSRTEGYMCEVGMTLREITYMLWECKIKCVSYR